MGCLVLGHWTALCHSQFLYYIIFFILTETMSLFFKSVDSSKLHSPVRLAPNIQNNILAGAGSGQTTSNLVAWHNDLLFWVAIIHKKISLGNTFSEKSSPDLYTNRKYRSSLFLGLLSLTRRDSAPWTVSYHRSTIEPLSRNLWFFRVFWSSRYA